MKTDVIWRHWPSRRTWQAVITVLCLVFFVDTAWAGSADQAGTSLADSRKAVQNNSKAHPIGSSGQSTGDSAANHNPAKAETSKSVSHGKVSVDNTHKGHPVGASQSGENK